MEEIKEYKIIQMPTLKSLEFWVNQEIKNGWKPQGGICIYEEGYLQAMVK